MDFLTLVNHEKVLKSNFVPKDLRQDSRTGIWICNVTLEAFDCLNKNLIADSLSPIVLISGYRDFDYQKKIFHRKVKNLLLEGLEPSLALQKASQVVAVPGTSEHQLGLAIDVTTLEMSKLEDPLVEDFEKTAEGFWLKQNSAKYGFILRYPKDKVSVTGITYEPWHYRYVGKTHALRMAQLGLCLEEYLNFYSELHIF